MSFRAFARLMKVRHSVVSKAAATGRLNESLGQDAHGRRAIVDVALATREFREGVSKLPRFGTDHIPGCEAEGPMMQDDRSSVENLFFTLFAYVVHEHARSCVTRWAKACPIEVDLAALRRWLSEQGYQGRP